jgi:hypothetical protein
MDSPQKVFYGVFEPLLLRNAQKRHKAKLKKKKRYLPTPFSICQIYVAFNFILIFGAPCEPTSHFPEKAQQPTRGTAVSSLKADSKARRSGASR